MSRIIYIGQDLFNEFETDTLENAVNWCLTQKELVVDTETQKKFANNTYDETVYKGGLCPYLTKIALFQIGNEERKYVIDARCKDIRVFKPVLESNSILKIFHNAKFDIKHLMSLGIICKNVWCTMICERILYNGLPYNYSLEACGVRHGFIKQKDNTNLFGEDNDEEEQDVVDSLLDLMDGKVEAIYVDKSIRTQFINWKDKPFTINQIEYGAKDLDIPLKLYQLQKEGRYVNGQLYLPEKAFRIENKFTIVLAQIERRGLKLDTEGWLNLYSKNKETYVEKVQLLNEWVEKFHPKFASTIDLFSSKPTCSIEWTSPSQVIKFFRYLGICPKEKSKSTGKIEWTVGAKAVFKLLDNANKDNFYSNKSLEMLKKDSFQEFMLNYLIVKKFQMLSTTFGKDFLRWIHPITKRIHCNFHQYMNTGRLSSSNPNFQNFPNGKSYRSLFICDKDEKVIAVDFKSQELRYLSVLANIENMKSFFIEEHPIFKDDFHSFSATNMFRIVRNDPNLVVQKKTHAKERNISKSLTFGINYGKGAFSVAQELGITEEEAIKFIDGFLDGFPGLRENFEMRKKLAVKNGWIELDYLTHRRYFFAEFEEMQKAYVTANSLYPPDWKTYSKETKEAWKAEIRETNPEYSKNWKTYMILKGKLERRALNFPIQGGCSTMSKIGGLLMFDRGLDVASLIHDEYVLFSKTENAEATNTSALECMVKAGEFFSNDVKFEGDGAIDDYWVH